VTGEQHADTVRRYVTSHSQFNVGHHQSKAQALSALASLEAELAAKDAENQRLRDALELRHWIERIKEAEKFDAEFGLYIPGDSALAVVFGAMEEAAYAGDPEFDSRAREALRGGDAT
jgi:hypothetical protein